MHLGETNSVTILPMGGLGNQLFIYGAGRALSELQGCELLVDVSLLRNVETQVALGFTPRQLELTEFEWPPNVRQVDLETKLVDTVLPTRFRLTRTPSPRRRGAVWYREPSPKRFTEDFFSLNKGVSLFGYFQAWRYLRPVEDDLRQEIAHLRRPSAWYVNEASRVRSTDFTIGLHVRRGDYPDPVEETYYRNALKLTFEMHSHGCVLVFSDDLAFARKMVEGMGYQAEYVDPPGNAPAIESMLLLSQCRVIITANSTFSWWAGWVAAPEATTVIAPRPWHTNSDVGDQDLLPPTWLTIGR